MRYRVVSAGMDTEVEAASPVEAFIAAVRQESPKSLGQIAAVASVNIGFDVEHEETVYVGTENALTRAGLWRAE